MQKEVARLEEELRNPEMSAHACLRSLLAEKELKIQQVLSLLSEKNVVTFTSTPDGCYNGIFQVLTSSLSSKYGQ